MNKRLYLLFAACLVLLGVTAPPAINPSAPASLFQPFGSCTIFYGSEGQTVLAGNNEDFNDPFTVVWFIPASPGQYGRVYFGYEDYPPQGGMNDQGLFFDYVMLPYKPMPLTNQRPHYPGGGDALADQAMATSANVQEAVDFLSRWYRPGAEYAQMMIGDRFGNSAILDGDTVLRKQGAFQIATSFRLSENPNPPYPEARYTAANDLLSNAGHFSVDLFRQVLDAAHAEDENPTVYSQVYELNTGIIHLYQYHDFAQEVVFKLADELAKGPHSAAIASLFPENPDLEKYAMMQELYWEGQYKWIINTSIEPASLAWMSGQYLLQEDGGAAPVNVYLEKDQLYFQMRNQLPVKMYPSSANTVFHHFFNGEDLTLTFQRDSWGRVSAQGVINQPSHNREQHISLVRAGLFSSTPPLILTAVAVLALLLIGGIFWWVRKHSRKLA